MSKMDRNVISTPETRKYGGKGKTLIYTQVFSELFQTVYK